MARSSFLGGVGMVLALGVGYVLGNLLPLQSTVPVQELTVQEDFLTNPMFYEWWTSAEGTVASKTQDSIVLEENGNSVTLKLELDTGLTQVFRENDAAGSPTPASFDDITVGSRIRSGVAIARKGTTGIAGEENVALATTLVILSPQ